MSAVLENAPIAIVLKDATGGYQYGNACWLARYGFTNEEIQGKTIHDCFPNVAPVIATQDRKVVETGSPVQFEYEEMDGGRARWFMVTKFPVIGANGRITSIATLETDVTDRKRVERALESELAERERAEEALKESEKRLRRITDNLPAFIAYIDSGGYYRSANKFYEDWFDRPIDKIVGGHIEDVLGFDNFAAVSESHRRALRGETLTRLGEFASSDGRKARVFAHYMPDNAPDGAVRGYYVLSQDVTELKRTEQALAESEARLAEAQQIANVGSWAVYVEDDRQTGTLWSAQLRRIFGIGRDAVPPDFASFLRFVHEEDRERVDRLGTRALESDAPYEVEHRIVRPSGEVRHILTKAKLLRDQAPGVKHWIGATTDVTERKLAEEKLRQAQKMEAVGQLTGGIAHDFNNLLTVISGNLELIRERVDGDSGVGGMIERGMKAVELGAALTDRLLSFSRKQSLRPTTIDINRLVSGMKDMLRRTLDEKIEIHTMGAEDPWLCHADQAQLENALLNLSINARDAMPDGGRLTIETANLSLPDKDAAARADVDPGHYVMLGVSDTGRGIAEETLKHVFEPFFTTKEIGKGSGLGLSMVYGFAKQSGGSVTISSEPGAGTTVRLYLPRAAE